MARKSVDRSAAGDKATDEGEGAPRSGDVSSSVRSLARGLSIIQCFDVEHPEWSLVEICERTNLHISTAFRLARTLRTNGFLGHDPASGKYHLGPSLSKVAYLALSNSELVRQARPHMERLASATAETVDLAVPVQEGVLFVAQVVTSRPFKPAGSVGMVFSDYTNGHRKVFLAALPWPRRGEALEQARGTLAPHAWKRLVEQVQWAADKGVAHDAGETTEGIYGIASPVRDVTGEVRASIGIVAPEERFGPEDLRRCVEELEHAALLLSRELGYRGSTAQP